MHQWNESFACSKKPKPSQNKTKQKTDCPIKKSMSLTPLKDQYLFKCTNRQLPSSGSNIYYRNNVISLQDFPAWLTYHGTLLLTMQQLALNLLIKSTLLVRLKYHFCWNITSFSINIVNLTHFPYGFITDSIFIRSFHIKIIMLEIFCATLRCILLIKSECNRHLISLCFFKVMIGCFNFSFLFCGKTCLRDWNQAFKVTSGLGYLPWDTSKNFDFKKADAQSLPKNKQMLSPFKVCQIDQSTSWEILAGRSHKRATGQAVA